MRILAKGDFGEAPTRERAAVKSRSSNGLASQITAALGGAPEVTVGKNPYLSELLTPVRVEDAGRFANDPNFWVQDKRNGQRRLIIKDGAKVYAFTRPSTRYPSGQLVEVPENIARVIRAVPYKSLAVDGEIEGERFVAFDLLSYQAPGMKNVRSLSSYAYADRWDDLKGLVTWCKRYVRSDAVGLVETAMTTKAKEQLILRLAREKAEGVVFKNTRARYKPGRAGQHFKLKYWKTLTARIKNPRAIKNSAELEVIDEKGAWRIIGKVSLIGKPPVVTGSIVEVKYLYATRYRKIVQATIIEVRKDVGVEACLMNQLKINRDELSK